MMTRRRSVLAGLGALAAAATFGLALPAASPADGAIRIGEINSYSSIPAFTLPYRNGWQLALEEINAAGGVLGKRLEVVSRDDGGRPGDAVTAANGLVTRDRVALLAGTFYSHIGLAVSDFARQKRILFLAAEPLTDALVWEKGHRYVFRLRPSTYMQAAMLAEEAARLPATRWATVAPNYEYGQAAVRAFRTLLAARRPDVTWVAEQWPALGKIDAGATIQALAQAGPEAIFNVTFGADLATLVREGHTRRFFEGRSVVSLLTGEPEYLDPLGSEAPEGWIVTGYPWYSIDTPEHERFLAAYRKRFGDSPRLGSVVGYVTLKTAAEAIRKAGSTDTERLVEAMEGLTLGTPFGTITYRAVDHQSTMGTYVGRTAVRDGKGVMVDWRYADGASYLPGRKTAAARRPD